MLLKLSIYFLSHSNPIVFYYDSSDLWHPIPEKRLESKYKIKAKSPKLMRKQINKKKLIETTQLHKIASKDTTKLKLLHIYIKHKKYYSKRINEKINFISFFRLKQLKRSSQVPTKIPVKIERSHTNTTSGCYAASTKFKIDHRHQ